MSQELIVACPHCGHEYTDDLELLNLDESHHFTCESCHQPFTAIVKECLDCSSETVFASAAATTAVTASMNCATCGKSFESAHESATNQSNTEQ